MSIKRRAFITLLGAAAWPLAARAQQASKIPRIGVLSPGPYEPAATLDAFQQGVRELGYTEGQNIAIERRYGDWKLDRLEASPLNWLPPTLTLSLRAARRQHA